MNKIGLIVQREFITRVRKKSFVIMALLGPFLFGLGLIVPLWIGTFSQETKVIEVFDQSGDFQYKLPQSSEIKFAYFNGSPDRRMAGFLESDHYALLHIPPLNYSNPEGIVLYSKAKPSPELKFYLEKILSQLVSLEKIKRSGLDEDVVNALDVQVSISSQSILESWQEEGEVTVSVVMALFSSIMIMFFIVLYGGQVMRGVIEEKTNRIIEVIISSVRPFELMMGKIIGIALVSLTQFLIWITLTSAISFFINTRYDKVLDMYSDKNIEYTLKNNPHLDVKKASEINQVINAFESLNIPYLLSIFLFYFLGGYLLYSALFAAIGSAVDVETDTQQFVFPLIAPLMFCIVMATTIVMNPDGRLAYWLSVIPFTSPVAMMLRVPFGVDTSELLLSMGMLLLSFLIFTWIAGRVYRIGILMYGKKVTLPELVKWIFFKG